MICFLIELIIINGDRGYKNGMGCCTKMGYGWNIVEHSLDIDILIINGDTNSLINITQYW